MIESKNNDDITDKKVLNYLKTKKESRENELKSDELYREMIETDDIEKKNKINEIRQKLINKNLADGLSTPSDDNIETNITIHKYTYHDAKIKEEWIKLLEKYPNNFVLGTE